MTTNERLKQLMSEYNLKPKQVRELLSTKYGNPPQLGTIRAWLADPKSTFYNPMPGHRLDLLEQRLITNNK